LWVAALGRAFEELRIAVLLPEVELVAVNVIAVELVLLVVRLAPRRP